MASSSTVVSNNKAFLQHLKDNSDVPSVASKKRTSLTITTEQLSQLILKHKMDLMLITQVTPMAQKMIYCFKFFADVLEMTSRLSERALEKACRGCEWHKVAANNLSLHLHEIWETIKKIEKNAKDWVRLPKQPEVVLAMKLRQAREKQQTEEQKHPTSDVVEQQPTTVQQPLLLQPASLQQPPPPSQQPSAEEALQECTPQKPEMQQPQLTPQRPEPVAMPRILRKKLEGGQVEALMPSGEAIWVPLTCGQGKCAWATLPNGQLLQTDIPSLLLGYQGLLGQKRTLAQQEGGLKRLHALQEQQDQAPASDLQVFRDGQLNVILVSSQSSQKVDDD